MASMCAGSIAQSVDRLTSDPEMATSNPLRKQATKEKNQTKNSDIFHISALNMDFGYSLEQPWQGGSNEYNNLCF